MPEITEAQRNGCLGCIVLPVVLIVSMITWAVVSDHRAANDPRAMGIPDATATAAQVIADSAGSYHGKDVAVSGEVAFVRGGTLVLGPLVDGKGIACYMRAPVSVSPGRAVTVRGICRPGDRGMTLDNAVIVP